MGNTTSLYLEQGYKYEFITTILEFQKKIFNEFEGANFSTELLGQRIIYN